MRKLKHDQEGIAAIIVTMILVLVIGLIVFSFAEVSTTNNNEVLVNQLGTQAYDAAESGINAAYQQLVSDITNSPGVYPASADTSCTGSQYYDAVGATDNGYLTSNGNVRVTCLLVDTKPSSLQDSSIPANSNVVWEVNPGSSNAINQLVLTWQGDSSDGTSCDIPIGSFPDYDSYTGDCNVPILETDIFQDNIPGSPSLSPTLLNQYTTNLYLQPEAGGSSTVTLTSSFNSYTYPTNPSHNPQIVSCDYQNGSCTETISVSSTAGEVYYIKISPLYEDATGLSLTANYLAGSTETAAPLQGEEAVIDSTAKDQTEVRRIQAYVTLQSGQNNESSNNAIESTNSVCKQVYVYSDTTDYSDDCTYP